MRALSKIGFFLGSSPLPIGASHDVPFTSIGAAGKAT